MKVRRIMFFAVVLVQLAVPTGMIVRREVTLREGEAFKFLTAPVDPYDAFRGRYVALSLDAREITLPPDHNYREDEKVYATIVVGENGVASFGGLDRTRPETGAYLAVRIERIRGEYATLQVPFDRYYMNEDEAPQAEVAYRKSSASGTRTAHLLIRVRNGYGVIEDLIIEGVPVREYLQRGID